MTHTQSDRVALVSGRMKGAFIAGHLNVGVPLLEMWEEYYIFSQGGNMKQLLHKLAGLLAL